jgi:serine phosphatase RsbU (regulator of sigma subunit)
MRLRTQLAFAFLLLAVVPLGAIVLYSYVSSTQAFRRAVEAENQALAEEMEERLWSTRERLKIQIAELGRHLPFGSPASPEALERAGVSGDRILAQVAAGMGEALPYVESLEFIPEASAAPGAVQGKRPAAVLFLDPSGAMKTLKTIELPKPPAPPVPAASGTPSAEEIRGTAEAVAEKLRQKERILASVRESLKAREEALQAAASARAELSPSELEALEQGRKKTWNVIGDDLDCTIGDESRVVGKVRAQVRAQALLQSVLAATRRDRGEIPFAVDAEGHLYAARPEDVTALRGLSLAGEGEGASDSWVIASKEEAETGLRFGIARPIGAALQEMRRTTARNFAWGLGLIGLCFAGIFPLSGRITRNVGTLTTGAEQIARGDLTARVPVRSRDELGRLADAFNRMAHDLSAHQERLLEEERLRKERELERRLLEAEHDRKSRELEQARQFQLSLLPRELPARPDLELAVYTRTAAEVGGDYYDVLQGDDGSLTLAIGDATGHGAAAGTMVTVVKGLFTARAGETAPASFLREANGVIRRMQLGRMAMALSVLQLRGRTVRFASAGMPPVFLHRARTGEVEEICLEATPLGAMADCRYPERELEVETGDTLLLLTDGFPELQGASGDLLGYARVPELFAASAAKPPGDVIADLTAAADAWRGEMPLQDDVTFVVLKVREG